MKTTTDHPAESLTHVHRLLQLSWVEIEQLDKKRTVVLLPVSPIEEHGPHLPVGTDVFGAEDIAAEAACHISRQGNNTEVVLAPVIPLGCAPITSDFPGTFSISGHTFKALISEVCESLVHSGFCYIVIVNHHLDSVHLKAILEAIEMVEENNDVRIVETAGRILYSGLELAEIEEGKKLGLDMKAELHADMRETSYILYKHKELLKGDYRALQPVRINIKQGLKDGKKTFKEMGATDGYLGSPGTANEDIGRIHLEEQGALVSDMVAALFNGGNLPKMRPAIIEYLKNRVNLD